MRSPSFALLLTTVLLPACSPSVVDGSAAGTSGAGGSSATSSSGATTSTGAAPDAGLSTDAGKVCGGKAGIPCAADEWCAYPPQEACGLADGTGVCKTRPQVCAQDCPGVCGCNGSFYCNACMANGAGVDVGPNAKSCAPPSEAVYSVVDFATNVARFMIFKTYPQKNVCVRLMVESIGGSGSGIQCPAGWSAGFAEISHHASDCAAPGGFPPAPAAGSVTATSETGVITMAKGGPGPCAVGIHAKLSFPAGAPWVPVVEAMDADGLMAQAACF